MTQTEKEKKRGRWLTRRRELRPAGGRWRLRLGCGLLVVFYIVTLFADFLSPYDYRAQSRNEPAAPPTPIRFRDAEGAFHLRPFIYARRLADPLTRRYEEDTSKAYPLGLLVSGSGYRLLGILPTNRHAFGVSEATAEAPRLYLLGADALGRDRFSRLLIASRFSLLVAPLATLLAGALGVLLGCLAGYGGRWLDALLMRAVDVMMALPTLILILAARAAFPLELPPLRAGILLVTIFTAVGWAEIARLARGEVLALRQRDFVLAARSLGLSQMRILARHILPNMARPLIVQLTLLLPTLLLAETALSYLGVGVQEPEPSWGTLLAAASDLPLLQSQPLVLLAPALAIFLFVLATRLLSDGLQRHE